MKYKDLRKALLEKPEAEEDFPFGIEVAVFKVRGKMFATLGEADGVAHANLKCDPDEALALRDIFKSVTPGYHMNKKHWNTLVMEGDIPKSEVLRMIDMSYSLVVKGLTKAQRVSLEIAHGADSIYYP